MIDISQRAWGRHVEHDPRSRGYAVEETGRIPGDVIWPRFAPILDQGATGSCTGNAAAGALGTAPFCHSVDEAAGVNEDLAVRVYTMATHLDRIPGGMPDEDTGSTGLAACKALRQLGLIDGYRWAFTTNGLRHALQAGPALLGVAWHAGMDDPDPYGVVWPTGPVRGGHEVLCRGIVRDMLICDNSWGPDWGLNGTFMIPLSGWEVLRVEHADVAVPLPIRPGA